MALAPGIRHRRSNRTTAGNRTVWNRISDNSSNASAYGRTSLEDARCARRP